MWQKRVAISYLPSCRAFEKLQLQPVWEPPIPKIGWLYQLSWSNFQTRAFSANFTKKTMHMVVVMGAMKDPRRQIKKPGRHKVSLCSSASVSVESIGVSGASTASWDFWHCAKAADHSEISGLMIEAVEYFRNSFHVILLGVVANTWPSVFEEEDNQQHVDEVQCSHEPAGNGIWIEYLRGSWCNADNSWPFTEFFDEKFAETNSVNLAISHGVFVERVTVRHQPAASS